MAARKPRSRRPARAAEPTTPLIPAGPDARTVLVGAVLLIVPIAYLALFFSVPVHRAVWWMALVPDQIVHEWVGGSWDRVRLGDRFPVLVMAGLLQVSAIGYGFVLLRVLGWPAARLGRRFHHWPVAASIGLGCHSVMTVTAGWLGLISYRWLFWLILLAGVPVFGVAGWNAWHARRRLRMTWDGRGLAQASAALLLTALLSYAVLAAVLPPSSFDVREYHLQVPKEWYQQGRVTFMSHNVYGNMPLGAEMAALQAAVLWGGPQAWWWGALVGKVTMASYTGWCAAWLLAMGIDRKCSAAGWVAALLVVTTPWVTQVSIAGLNEGCLALYFTGVVCAVIRAVGAGWSSRSAQHWWGVAGILAGLACGVKYPAVVFLALPLIGALIIAVALRRVEWKTLVTVLVLAALFGGVWYVKNAALSGNPVYPLAARWLDGKTRTEERIEQWERAHQVPRDADGRRYSMSALDNAIRTIGWRSTWLAPALVPLAVLGALRRWRDRETMFLVGTLLVWLAIWFLATHRIERFIVPAVGVAAWLAAGNWLRPWPGPWNWVCVAIAVLGIGHGALASVTRMCGDNRILVSLDDLRDDLPREEDPGMTRTDPIHVWLNRRAPFRDGDAVLLVGDAQPFDLERPVYYNTCFDATWLERWFAGVKNPAQRRSILRRHHVRYVVVRWDEIARYRKTYGYSPYITRALIDEQLWRGDGILRRLPVTNGRDVEVFEVSD